MKSKFELVEKKLLPNLTKLNRMILKELLEGRTYPSIYKNLIDAGYQIKNEEAVRSIIRKLKKKYQVNTLFQLGAFYSVDLQSLNIKYIEASLTNYEIQIEELKELIGSLKLRNLDLNGELIELTNKYEEEKIIYLDKLKELQQDHYAELSKRYAEGHMSGRRRNELTINRYKIASVILFIWVILSIVYNYIN